MTTTLHMHKKQWWYLATICGFTIGLAIGAWIGDYYHSLSGQRLDLFFSWASRAGGAGLGMGFAQWILIHRMHKNAFLWILATTIGVIVIVGGALLISVFLIYYQLGRITWSFSQLPSWFVPLSVLTPILIFIGPFLQWLILRNVAKSQYRNGFLKLSMGWIFSIVVLFIILGLITMFPHSRNDILDLLVGVVATIPSGIIFAYFTLDIIKNPLSESRRL